jgi:flap endonuclease-1
VRAYFLAPKVDDKPDIHVGRLDLDGTIAFLCGERGFAEDRVRTAIRRLESMGPRARTLEDFA